MAENKFKIFHPRVIYAIARGVAISAASFSLIVSVLMIANYFQVKALDPLESPAIQTLIQQLENNPDDALLQDQVRSLDLLARKAYFTSKWQIKTGSFLLLCGVALLLIALKVMSELSITGPEKDEFADRSGFWKEIHQARKWIYGFGAGLVILSLSLASLTQADMNHIPIEEVATHFPSQEEIQKNWPNFRGPGANGHAFSPDAPIDWNGEEGTHILWKTEVPKKGMSSPVVWDQRLFLTGADSDVRQVYCFDIESGSLLWQHDVKGIPGSPSKEKLPKVSDDTGFAAPTPATDGYRVIAIFATGDLVCLDNNGKRIWAKNLGVPDNHYGHSSSLLIHENLVYVQYDQNQNSKLFAFEIQSGKLKWEADRGPISWASPICIENNGRMELILTNSESADSYNPETGALLWHVNCLYGEVGPSAAYADGLVFVANEYAIAAAIQISEHQSTPEIIWEWDEYLPNASSPLANDVLLILATADGIVNCLNTETGTSLWEAEFDDGFYCSPILVSDRVYVTDFSGNTQIFKMDATYELLGSPALGEEVFATPAFVGDRIYMRGETHIFCIGS